MEEEIGQVVKVDQGKVKIQLATGSQCTHCSAKSICTSLGESVRVLEVESNEPVKSGDYVSLHFNPSTRIMSATVIFILPILFMIIGYFLMTSLYINSEGWGILGTLLGLFFGFIVVKILDRILARTKAYKPMIKKV